MHRKQIWIDPQVVDHPLTKRLIHPIADEIDGVRDADTVYRAINAASDPVAAGKQTLFITRNRGRFVRQCPGTRQYTCCGYKILHVGTFCSMDCSYCILQTYFHPPVLQLFANHDVMWQELDQLFQTKAISRIGTGEFTDSLIWEQWTDLSAQLIPRFAHQQRAVLELKSKSVAIDALEHLDHQRKTIAAWSLNTPRIIASEERGTASLEARLKAAARCQKWGYPVAFHFDPMVIYPGCEAEYREVVQRLFDVIAADNIVWISLGTFRHMPALKPLIQKRFDTSKIIYGEFITGLDGKMRYFKPLRIELYRRMADWIRQRAPQVMVYLCMEDEQVWKRSLGFAPSERGGLSMMLDRCAVEKCSLTWPS